jgi:parkin
MSLWISFLNIVHNMIQNFVSIFGIKKTINASFIRIFVKTINGQSVDIDLDPAWDIKNVKELVAPKLGFKPHEIKIIFAGKELSDSTTIGVSSRNYSRKKNYYFK